MSNINNNEELRSAVVGITIGSVYSSVAVIDKDGFPNVIANEDGERMIPTCVAFRGEEMFAGSQAHGQVVRNAKNTLYGFFDFLGQSLNDEIVKDHKASASYVLVEKDGKVAYEVEYKDNQEVFSAHEIAVKFLLQLKESAQAFLGKDISATVIAVPSYFTENQRKEIGVAANEAGLKVEQVTNEASVALLAYDYLDKFPLGDKNVVVVDFGGRSLDVTLLSAKKGIYTVLGSENSREVGGIALDEVLVQHFAKEFKTKTKIDITGNQRANAKLRVASEITKKTLSRSNTAPCSVESLAEGIDFHGSINRVRFELLASKIFNKVIATIQLVIEKSGYHVTDVAEIILIGGSSRIPKLISNLQYLFPETTEIRYEIETDEAVSRGCVMQAGLLLSLHETEDVTLDKLAQDKELTTAQHTSAPIGFNKPDGTFFTLVAKDTPLPLRRIVRFSHDKSQTSAYVQLYEAEKDAVTTQPEAPEKYEDDDEEPELPEPVTTYIWKAKKLVAELGLNEIDADQAQIELQIEIDDKVQFHAVLRDLTSGKHVTTA